MKDPRFSISWLMAVVLILALDFGAARALLRSPLFVPDLSDLLVYGALPMVAVLAIGSMYLLKSKLDPGGGSHALVGFLAFGMTALILYLGGSLLATHTIHFGVGYVVRSMGVHPGPIFLVGAVALLLLPQLVMALLGGWLGRRYKIRVSIVVERRDLPEASPERLVAVGWTSTSTS